MSEHDAPPRQDHTRKHARDVEFHRAGHQFGGALLHGLAFHFRRLAHHKLDLSGRTSGSPRANSAGGAYGPNRSDNASGALGAFFAGFAFLATAGIASAATDADSPRSIEIRYGDLDLSTEQGAVVLYRRIAAGAQRVCPPEDLHNLGAHARSRACQTAAIAQAVRAVDNPKLAAVEAAHSQKSAAPKSNA